jgi:hypothetical protein
MKSLQGNWRDEYLFIIEESYKFNNIYQERIIVCDLQTESQLKVLELLNNEGLLDAADQEWKLVKRKVRTIPI